MTLKYDKIKLKTKNIIINDDPAQSKQCAILCRSITGIVGSNPQVNMRISSVFELSPTFTTEDYHTFSFCRIHITTNLVEYSE